MIKLLSTVRSILNQLNNLVTKFNYPALSKIFWIGPFFFFSLAFSFVSASTIKLAVIDTGFCPTSKTSQSIHSVIDLTASVKLDCKKVDLNSPRLHGQKVLNEFFKFADLKKNKFEIYPVIVFDSKGDQKKEYWLKALEWVRENKIDVVLTAAGFITTAEELKTLPATLPSLWFVPSGRISPQVKDSTILFPQGLAPQKNLFLIGDYYDGKMILFDQGLLYKDKIDYYFPSGKGAFTGTSRAVAEACATALKLCADVTDMRACLLKKKKDFVDGISQKRVQSY
jgi:hypothetical protein